MTGLPPRAAELLRLVHDRPGLTRAEAARALTAGTGTVATLVARLGAQSLVAEAAAPRPRTRGRPTTALVPHPDGPMVAVGLVSHRDWRTRLVGLGGQVVAETTGGFARTRDGRDVLRDLRDATAALTSRAPGRVLGAGIALPGPVRDNRWFRATLLGWPDQDVQRLWAAGAAPDAGVPLLVVGNDATLAALAEARRGAARGARTHVHLTIGIGMGGGVTSGGIAVEGGSGAAGEFGHIPLGDQDRPCPCGARGCWGKMLDGQAFARLLDEPEPTDPLAYSVSVLERAEAGEARPLAAVRTHATWLGRGTAGVVNALDPELVTLGGLAARLVTLAPSAVHEAYRDGLMSYRRREPPRLLPAPLGGSAPLVGAAEQVWDRVIPTL